MAVLALGRRAAVLGPARVLAAGAACTVIGVELLPHALVELGPLALAVAAGAALLPVALDRGFTRLLAHRGPGTSAQSLGFAAVAVHQVFDGLQAGAARTLGLGVVLAVALHGAPLVAAAVLAWPDPRQGLRRGLALVAATALGVALALAVPGAQLDAAAPWVGALVSGFLLHVVLHDLHRDLPATAGGRAAEAMALLAGCGGTALLLTGWGHADHAHGAVGFPTALLQGSAQVAGPALLGLALALLLQRRGWAHPRRVPSVDTVLATLIALAWWDATVALTLGAVLHGLALSAATPAPRTLASRLPPLAAGLVLGAWLHAAVPPQALAWGGGWTLVATLAVAVLARRELQVALPVAGAASQLGLGVVAALAGLLAGAVAAAPPPEGPTARRLRVGVAGGAAVLGALLAWAPAQHRLVAPLGAGVAPGPSGVLCGVLLIAAAAALVREGVRRQG